MKFPGGGERVARPWRIVVHPERRPRNRVFKRVAPAIRARDESAFVVARADRLPRIVRHAAADEETIRLAGRMVRHDQRHQPRVLRLQPLGERSLDFPILVVAWTVRIGRPAGRTVGREKQLQAAPLPDESRIEIRIDTVPHRQRIAHPGGDVKPLVVIHHASFDPLPVARARRQRRAEHALLGPFVEYAIHHHGARGPRDDDRVDSRLAGLAVVVPHRRLAERDALVIRNPPREPGA